MTPTEKRRKRTDDALGYLQKKADQGKVLGREKIDMRKQEQQTKKQQRVENHSTRAGGAAELKLDVFFMLSKDPTRATKTRYTHAKHGPNFKYT